MSPIQLSEQKDAVCADDPPACIHQANLIYGHKYGLALTLDVFKPAAQTNGLGIVYVLSAGWRSSERDPDACRPYFASLLRRGYTVFTVVHGSLPKFTVPEMVADLHRAVRFIRYHAAQHGIDPARIGITGSSAGGHLALMLGSGGTDGDPVASDPVDRVSSTIQAVACFYPPTDFLNWGQSGEAAWEAGRQARFAALFDFHEWDPILAKFVAVTNLGRMREMARSASPIYLVSANSAPTFIMHGDCDTSVPLQQSEIMVAKLRAAGVETCLVVRTGGGHCWPDFIKDTDRVTDWFDQRLKPAAMDGTRRATRSDPAALR